MSRDLTIKGNGFSFERVLTVSARVLKQLVRDRRTFAMIMVMPLVIMFIFGVALSGEATNIPVLVDNQDQGDDPGIGNVKKSLNIITELEQDERVDLEFGDYNDGINGVEDGEYRAAIRFPRNFTSSLFLLQNDSNVKIIIELYLDATKPQIKASVLGALQESISDGLEVEVIVTATEFGHGGVEFTGLETAIPAVMGYVLTFLVLLLSILILIRERIEGTQYRLYSTPLRSKERLLGYIIALILFAIVEAGSILAISIYLFEVPVRGSFLLLIGVAIFYGLVNVLIAVFMSNYAQNELQAVQMAVLVALPSLAISGLLIPISSLPGFLQPIAKIIPLTYAVQIFEGVMLKGWGVSLLWKEITLLFVIGSFFLILAIATVKDHEE